MGERDLLFYFHVPIPLWDKVRWDVGHIHLSVQQRAVVLSLQSTPKPVWKAGQVLQGV